MRGINRTEKQDAIELFKDGKKPAEVRKILTERYDKEFPLSTITTWYSDFRPKKNLADCEKRTILRDLAKDINDSEARIMVAIGDILSEDMSDRDYFKAQQAVLKELQEFVLITIPYLLANTK